jgi:hypothetical protein
MSFFTAVIGIDPVIRLAKEKRYKEAVDKFCDWLESKADRKSRDAVRAFTAFLRNIPIHNDPLAGSEEETTNG